MYAPRELWPYGEICLFLGANGGEELLSDYLAGTRQLYVVLHSHWST